MASSGAARLSDIVTAWTENRSLKGEDAYATSCDDRLMKGSYGVFDSHGGKEAGTICADQLIKKLLSITQTPRSGSDAFPLSMVDEEFWAVDKHLGANGVMSGTTASVLMVAASAKGPLVPTLNCKLAWVGDSTACVVDMTADTMEPVHRTSDHNPSNAKETQRMEWEWQVRAELRAIAAEKREAEAARDDIKDDDSFRLLVKGEDHGELSKDSFYAKSRAPTLEEVREAVKAMDLAGLDERDLQTLVRALGREKRIEAPEKRKSLSSPPGKPMLTRANSSIIKRVSENDPSVHGPTVLAGGSSHNGSKHGVVNVCVTRSIGDWDGARAMIPQPDVLTFEVQPSSHMRVIICSDGVWDMMTLEEACKITRRASTAKAAAQSIVEKAYNRGMAKFERLKDDTTCVFASALCLIVPARSLLRAPVQIAYFDVCRLSCLAPRPRQVHGRRY